MSNKLIIIIQYINEFFIYYKKIAANCLAAIHLPIISIKNYYLMVYMVCLEPSFISKVTRYIPCFNSPK